MSYCWLAICNACNAGYQTPHSALLIMAHYYLENVILVSSTTFKTWEDTDPQNLQAGRRGGCNFFQNSGPKFPTPLPVINDHSLTEEVKNVCVWL